MLDPTYNREEIDKNPVWELAFCMSEIMNDDAPLRWSKYIPTAECLFHHYDIKRKEGTTL